VVQGVLPTAFLRKDAHTHKNEKGKRDGVVGVYTGFPSLPSASLGQEEALAPVVVYHCAAGRVTEKVTFAERNHYVAAYFVGGDDRFRTANTYFAAGAAISSGLGRGVKRSLSPARSQGAYQVKRKGRAPREALGAVRPDRGDDLNSLIAVATTVTELSDEQLAVLRHNYGEHPKLALLYFHCCLLDPACHVFNDEKLQGQYSGPTVERLMRELDESVHAADIEVSSEDDAEYGKLWGFVGLRFLLRNLKHRGGSRHICSFRRFAPSLSAETASVAAIPAAIVKHIQVFEAAGIMYHLNPELVRNVREIPLRAKCASDPRQSAFSIACGHDYGLPGNLQRLNDVASKCIAPVRVFGLAITAFGKHSVDHSICFPSSGSAECSKVLPCCSDDCIPSVTFIGPREEWRLTKGRYRELYRLHVESMYAWMRVLVVTHSYFTENDIRIDESPAASVLRGNDRE